MRLVCTVALLLLMVLQSSHDANAEARVALVIGNSNYAHTTRLANPANDANLVGSILRRQGFDVLIHIDLDFKGMKRAIKAFTTKLEQSGRDTVGLVFYAGHGLQSEGVNFLLPVDADVQKEGDIAIEAIDASSMLGSIRVAGNRLNIVILDACRNTPYEGRFRSSARGLARMDAPIGSLVAYSTSPGSVAADGDTINSPFTQALTTAMVQPGLKIEDVFKQTRQSVYKATGGKQVPWESSSIFGDFYFQPATTTDAGADTENAPDVQSIELAFWDAVKDSGNPQLLHAYLEKYPDGSFATIARSLIDQTKKQTPSADTNSSNSQTKTAAVAPHGFDGQWKVERISPSCKRKKAKHLTFKMWIQGGKIRWRKGQGSINQDGTFKMTSKVVSGARATYSGRLDRKKGSGRFHGRNLSTGGSCTGTITLTRLPG